MVKGDCFVGILHLIRQASPATFPSRGRLTVVRTKRNFADRQEMRSGGTSREGARRARASRLLQTIEPHQAAQNEARSSDATLVVSLCNFLFQKEKVRNVRQ